MLFIFSTLIFLLPFAAALTLNLPTVAVDAAGPVTVTWTSVASDPANFDLRLVNAAYHNTFALSASVITSTGSITLNLPLVQPGTAYQLQATVVSNVNAVLSTTGDFTIAAPASSSTTSTLTGSTTNPLTTTSVSNTNSLALSSATATSSTASSTTTPFNGASSVGLNGFTSAFAIVAAAAGAALAGY